MNTAFALSRRPPVDVPPAAASRARVGVGRGCGCASSSDVADVMADIGMFHAAAMHRDPEREWTSDDWRTHLGEEHATLFPYLREVGAGDPTIAKNVDRLEADHAVYLDRLAAGLPLPRGSEPYSIDVHGRLEDGLVREYAGALRSIAAGSLVGVGAGPIVLERVVPADEKQAATPTPSASTWSLGKLAILGGLLAAGGWAYGWIGAGLAGLGGALVIPRVGGSSSSNGDAAAVIATIHLTDPPPGAPKASTVDMGALQDQFDQEVTNYYNERNAREKAYDDDMDTYAKWVGAAGPEAYAAAKILAGAAKAIGAAVKALQHNPDAKEYVEDAKRLWVMIGQAGLAPPPYGPVADVLNIETYKSNLYDAIDKLRQKDRGLAYQPAMLELGYWTKKTIANDPRVAAWYAALANGGQVGKTAGEVRGEGPPCLAPKNADYTACHAGTVMSVWDASSAALAGTVAASVMGVPLAGPVNAAIANLEGFTTRHPGANTGNNDNSEFNLAQIIATVDAWNAAKAEASREAGRPWPSSGVITPPWPMTGDI